jgi:hypothetical protein
MPPPSGSTPILHAPYPIPDDTVDVPRDIKALADWLEANYGGGGAGGGGVLQAVPVLDVGLAGQIRAGRQLSAADFTSMGLAVPRGLWNLSDATDSSGNGRNLTNKGGVGFAAGINGAANTAAQFTGTTAQALYIADTGAADPFRITQGSWGCWFRTAKRGVSQQLIGKNSFVAGNYGWSVYVLSSNICGLRVSGTGSSTTTPGVDTFCDGVSDVADDRWHFVVCTQDAGMGRLYVDGTLESTAVASGMIFPGSGPLSIGINGADGATAGGNSHFGRIDEAFVTADVLSEEEVRLLYAAKLSHSLGIIPADVSLRVHRRRKGATWVVGDFTTQPLRLYNFTQGSATVDEGSQNQALAWAGTGANGNTAAADGLAAHGMNLQAGDYMATDAGLPGGTNARSYGAWFKTTNLPGVGQGIIGWGTIATGDTRLWTGPGGGINCSNGGDAIASSLIVADGQWHLTVAVEDNAAVDGLKRKMYLDGRLLNSSTVLNPIVLAGANRFRIGAVPDGNSTFTGQIDGAFVCGYAMSRDEVIRLYAKGTQDLGASPKNAGDHVERMDANSLHVIFDTLESQYTIDLGVTV